MLGDPVFGFAYRIDNKTSIRGGYGIYYGGLPANQFAGTAESRLLHQPNGSKCHQWLLSRFLLGHWLPIVRDPASARH